MQRANRGSHGEIFIDAKRKPLGKLFEGDECIDIDILIAIAIAITIVVRRSSTSLRWTSSWTGSRKELCQWNGGWIMTIMHFDWHLTPTHPHFHLAFTLSPVSVSSPRQTTIVRQIITFVCQIVCSSTRCNRRFEFYYRIYRQLHSLSKENTRHIVS